MLRIHPGIILEFEKPSLYIKEGQETVCTQELMSMPSTIYVVGTHFRMVLAFLHMLFGRHI